MSCDVFIVVFHIFCSTLAASSTNSLLEISPHMLKFGSSLSMLRSKIIFMKTKKKTGDTVWHVTSFPWSILYGTCQENMGFSEMRGGMNMCWTLYLKMRITGCCEILVYEQTMKLRLGDWIYWSLTKKRNNCNIIDVTITDNGRWKGASKRAWVLRKIPKSHKRNSKDVRCKDNDEQGSLGTFWRCRLSKSEVKGACCWLLAGVDENCIWHLYLRVLAVIIIIINFINFFETGLQIGIAGFVANTGNI